MRNSNEKVKHGHIASSKKEGKIRRIGPDKGGYWEVLGEGKVNYIWVHSKKP